MEIFLNIHASYGIYIVLTQHAVSKIMTEINLLGDQGREIERRTNIALFEHNSKMYKELGFNVVNDPQSTSTSHLLLDCNDISNLGKVFNQCATPEDVCKVLEENCGIKTSIYGDGCLRASLTDQYESVKHAIHHAH